MFSSQLQRKRRITQFIRRNSPNRKDILIQIFFILFLVYPIVILKFKEKNYLNHFTFIHNLKGLPAIEKQLKATTTPPVDIIMQCFVSFSWYSKAAMSDIVYVTRYITGYTTWNMISLLMWVGMEQSRFDESKQQ